MKQLLLSSFRLTALFIILISSQCVFGATKYVSNSGNNANTGNSLAQAWLTLEYASEHVTAGDSVIVADGTYVGFDMDITGTVGNPIVFMASGNNCVINVHNPVTMDGINVEGADYIEIKGFRVINQPRNGIRVALSNHCIVRNCYCSNAQKRGIFTGFTDDLLLEYNECLGSIDEHGIYVSNSSDRSIIRYNICHNNRGGGIQINADGTQGGDGISTDPEIYGNVIYENGIGGGAGINLDGVQSAFIYNNLLYENHASGIALFMQDGSAPSINATIAFNTIVNASNARWCVLIVNGASGAQVYNNILINQNTSNTRGAIALDPDAVPGFNSDYNILTNKLSKMGDGVSVPLTTWQTYGYDAHSVLPQALSNIFTSPGLDYHLSTNSQAINIGSTAFAFGINADIEGVTRPQGNQMDLGAYEALSSLGIDDEEDSTIVSKPEFPIIITSEKISWSADLEGQMYIMTTDGKIISKVDIAYSLEYSLKDLTPGIYLATFYTNNGVKWNKWFFKN